MASWCDQHCRKATLLSGTIAHVTQARIKNVDVVNISCANRFEFLSSTDSVINMTVVFHVASVKHSGIFLQITVSLENCQILGISLKMW